MRGVSYRRQWRRLALLFFVVLLVAGLYMSIGVHFDKPKLFAYAMKIRSPKLFTMAMVSVAIGGAAIIFQSVIRNHIVTPCLLGMDGLYALIHTAIVFFAGTNSVFFYNPRIAFVVDATVMGVVAMVVYSYLFQKTKYNVLYVLLVGTVLTSLFYSIQSTLVRVMDPNEFDSLLVHLVASFSNMNTEVIVIGLGLLLAIVVVLWRDLKLLDVLTLGRDQAINLGVDYNRSVRRLLLGVTLLIALASAMVGPLAFLGLIVANLARQFVKTYRHSILLSASILFSMLILIGGQVIVERVFTYTIPVSVFITSFGGIYFLYLVLRPRRA